MPSLFKTAVIFIPLCFLLHTEAAPLKWQLPHILGNPVETDSDNTYGPWEKNSWIGNEHPDDLHHDDLWPPMVPPRAAFRRDGPLLKTCLTETETDITKSGPATSYSHECPMETKGPLLLPYGCHRCSVPPRRFVDSPESSSPATVIPTIQKRDFSTLTAIEESAHLYTGAQQWQEYWNHKAPVISVPTPNVLSGAKTSKLTLAKIVQSSSISTTGETTVTSAGTPLSTGAQQWQIYWDHLTPRQLLTEEAKFDLFTKVFALPEYLTAAVIVLAQSLVRVNPQPQILTRDMQPRGPVAAMAMCDVVSQTLTQSNFQQKNSSDVLASAIRITCKSLAQLYPQHMVQAQRVTMSQKLIIAKMFDFFNKTTQTETLAVVHISKDVLIQLLLSGDSLNKGISRHANTVEHIESRSTAATNAPTESPGEIEVHTTSYSHPPTHASASSSAIPIHGTSTTHNSALHPRAFYLFQPLEQAYTWMNDMYDTAIGRHPRFPYSDPAQNINGCIYYPSPDHAAITGKVICPPSDDHK